jgi:hypothetical protein
MLTMLVMLVMVIARRGLGLMGSITMLVVIDIYECRRLLLMARLPSNRLVVDGHSWLRYFRIRNKDDFFGVLRNVSGR